VNDEPVFRGPWFWILPRFETPGGRHLRIIFQQISRRSKTSQPLSFAHEMASQNRSPLKQNIAVSITEIQIYSRIELFSDIVQWLYERRLDQETVSSCFGQRIVIGRIGVGNCFSRSTLRNYSHLTPESAVSFLTTTNLENYHPRHFINYSPWRIWGHGVFSDGSWSILIRWNLTLFLWPRRG